VSPALLSPPDAPEIPAEEILEAARMGKVLALRRAPAAIKRDAEDVFQEACLGALRAKAKYRHGSPAKFVTFAVPFARGKAIDSYRRGKYPRQHETLDPRLPERSSGPAPESRFIVQALSTLPDPQGRIIALVFWEELEQREIADLLGMGASSVGKHYLAGMRTLRTIIASRFNLSDLL
jgi:RNA polymerase sigma factor (sigma-70 family)